MKILFTTLVFVLLYLQINAQQPGTLDKSFGEDGKVVSTTYEGVSNCSALQPDGKIIVGGYGTYLMEDGLIYGAFLARYNTNGTLDLSFGDSGRVVINNSGVIYAIGLQKDDKIVAAIRGYSTKTAIVIMRINEDGTLDKSFGEDGLAFGPVNDGYNESDMTLLPDGRMVIAGDVTLAVNDNNRSFITCFTPDGTLDKSFGEGGTIIIEFSGANDIRTVAATPDGKIVIGGEYKFYDKTILMRYNGDGTPDKSFGTNGLSEISFDSKAFSPIINDITITKDNSITLAGWAYMDLDYQREAILISKVLANGTPDNGFGTTGFTTTEYKNKYISVRGVAVQQDEKIVIAGGFGEGRTSVEMITRYNQDGGIDSSFGTDGITKTYFNGVDEASSLLIQKDGKIILTGTSETKEEKALITLARYNSDDNNQQPLIVRIKRWLQHRGISWQGAQGGNDIRYYAVQRSSDGITYKEIGRVGKKVGINNYEDDASGAGNSYYRIAAVGWDGSRTYSNTVLISDLQGAKVFPNPVRDNLQLQGLPQTGKTNVSIVDWNGNVRSTATTTGTNYSVNTANLSAGAYLLKIQHNGTTATQPFVKE